MSNKMDRPLVTVDGRTLMDRPLEPPNFVVDTLISQGLHILAGSPKVGKSWLALWLAVTVAKGEPVWGMSVKQGTTLYLCLEDSVLRIQNRLFEITEDAPDSVHFCTECAPIGQGLEEQVEGFLVAHPDTVLVLVDTLQMVRPVHDATYANDYRDLSVLKRLADKHGIAILLIHHLRKETADDVFNRKKTEFEGQQLVTGINCQPESVYADFMTTKRLYHKTDGVLFYHMVQSFPKGEAVDPVTAHAAALKLAEYYEGYEVLVCTHTDREHIHSHFLINSVNFDTGRKLHIAKEQLQELRQRNDMVCKEFSLPVFQPREQKQKTKTMTIGEYHTAARGQSKKLQLTNIINDCMRHASNREEFIALMESEGYKVRWEKSRKNITYTTPSGWQCRDRLLFGDKYLKENMEYEFRIREEIIYGRAHGPEPARAFTAADSAGVEFTDHAHCHPVSVAGGSDDADTEDRIHRVGSAWNAGVSSEPEITHRPDSGAEQHGEDPEIVDGDDHSAGTGWEEERKAFLQMAGLASGLRPDRSGQMDRTGTAHRGGTAGDGVWHSDSGQQHPQPVSMKPIHAGLYGLAVTGALLDDGNEDVEERYRRIQAEQEAKNIGAVIGLVAGVAMVLTQDEQSSTEQQWTEDQQAEQTQQQTM